MQHYPCNKCKATFLQQLYTTRRWPGHLVWRHLEHLPKFIWSPGKGHDATNFSLLFIWRCCWCIDELCWPVRSLSRPFLHNSLLHFDDDAWTLSVVTQSWLYAPRSPTIWLTHFNLRCSCWRVFCWLNISSSTIELNSSTGVRINGLQLLLLAWALLVKDKSNGRRLMVPGSDAHDFNSGTRVWVMEDFRLDADCDDSKRVSCCDVTATGVGWCSLFQGRKFKNLRTILGEWDCWHGCSLIVSKLDCILLLHVPDAKLKGGELG